MPTDDNSMLNPEQMDADKYISLIKASEIENLDDLECCVYYGPLIADCEGRKILFVDPLHYERFMSLWPEIESIWNG